MSQQNILNLIELKDRASAPIYAQVRDQLQQLVKDKAIAGGEALPSPAQIAQKLSVDRGEVQRAFFELEQYGLIKKVTGRGFLDSVTVSYVVV
ncbi:MAG: GntR family transcriptional regulator [Pyrinomonadaceae bacterium]